LIILKKDVARALPVLLVDSAGAVVTGVVEGSVTVVTSKDGGALTGFTLTGKWTELGQGLYTIDFADTDLDTVGFFAYLVTVTGCDQYSGIMYVDDALPTAGENADAVWDEVITSGEHGVPNSGALYLRRLYQTIVSSVNQAQTGAAGSITLAATESATNDFFKGQVVSVFAGTGKGQARACYGYDGESKIALIRPIWATNPDNTSWYAVINVGSAVIAAIDDIDFSDTMKASIDTAVSDLALEATVDAAEAAILANEGTMETNLTATINESESNIRDGAYDLHMLYDDLNAIQVALNAIKGIGWTDENLTTIDALIDDIKERTNNLPDDPADESLLEAALIDRALDIITQINADIATAEGNIRGTDDDTLKTLSEQLDLTALEATLTAMKGAGWTFESLESIQTAIDADVLNNLTILDDEVGAIKVLVDYLKQKESGRWKIENNQLTYYEDDGTTVLRRFNLFNKDGAPSGENPYERVPV